MYTLAIWLGLVGAPAPPPLPASMTPTDMVNAVAFSPDGELVVCGGDDGFVRVYEAASGRAVRSFAPSAAQHAAAMGRRPGRGTGVYTDVSDDVEALVVTPDGAHVIAAGGDETVRVWELASGKLVREIAWGAYALPTFDGGITSLALTPDGKRVAAGSYDGTIKVWDLASGDVLMMLPHGAAVMAVDVAPDGALLASGGHDGIVRLWDLATGLPVAALAGHKTVVEAVRFAPDGKTLWSGSDALTIFNRDLGTDTVVDDGDLVQPHSAAVVFMAWDVGARKPLFGSKLGGVDEVTAIAVSPDGHTAYLGVFENGKGHAVVALDVVRRKSVARWLDHAGNVATVAVSRDGRRVAANRAASVVVSDPKGNDLREMGR